MIQSNLQENKLHDYHDNRLYQEGIIESRAGVVEYPASLPNQHIVQVLLLLGQASVSHLSIEATSMIRGMSKEKPALDFELCIE